MSTRLTSLTLHRETVRLAVLSVVTAAAFVATAAVAAQQRAIERGDAQSWFERAARASAAGDAERATAALRRAVSLRPRETSYVLALADALSESGQFEAATRALMRIRADAPDDPIVNRAIARVAARRHDVASAVRYYHNALYGPWPSAEGPRSIRLELIRFLLDHDATRRAVSELIAATTDLPDTAAAHLELAQLFAEAGEPGRALEFFTSALALSPDNRAAIEGGIAMAFVLGDYARVAAYPVPPGASEATRQQAETAAAVIANDPLAARLGIVTRRRRMSALIARMTERAAACRGGARPGVTLPRSADTDDITAALDHVLRETIALDPDCPAAALDRAIPLIARRHGITAS